ncbi:MAG TPA: response regulator transcription factor [Bryobacteraceae bacterium]|nr:response regulator transcription factor [Bryobacteraceae bacterium]
MSDLTTGIVEDEDEVRQGLSFFLNHAPGIVCRHVYNSVETAMAKIGDGLPQVLLLDIGLPGVDGIQGVRLLRESHPALAIIILTVFRDEDRVFRAICAGACGYLLKTSPPERILSAIREVAAGGAAMSPEIAGRVLDLFRRQAASPSSPAGTVRVEFTPQENRLLRLLADGHQNKTAAAEMAISIHTVGFHLKSIYGKLHVHSRAEAVARALRDRLI